MGLGMCGPMLIGCTQEQKDCYLPRILSGEDYWCQGTLNPVPGRTLRAKLRATSDGDDFILNGSKIWTPMRTTLTKCFCWFAATTAVSPKKASPLLPDMDSLGFGWNPSYLLQAVTRSTSVFR